MRTLLVAGGSGGHLIPALTVARRLKEEGPCRVLSTRRPVDRLLQELSAEEWVAVDLERFTPWHRWFSPRFCLRQGRALRKIWKTLRAFQPDVVVGFGGYVSFAAILLARVSGVPGILHEQNLLPGRANRWASPFARTVAVSFHETRKHLGSGLRVEVTGNPIRPEFQEVSREEAQRRFGLDLRRRVLLVVGGSQGSEFLNRLCASMWQEAPVEERQEIQILHVAGPTWAQKVETAYREMGIQAKVFSFLKEFPLALGSADVVISRAGATSIAEICALSVPAILIPYPYAGGHQRANARWMESVGGAVVLEEKEASAHRLRQELSGLLKSPERLQGMRKNLLSRKDGSAADRLRDLILGVAG
ncbi:MAG: undecaprenyldiphospho-muramoylpentapeptide beta-N-acetylglucosaminyltransferase [Candidatus Omnitrophica bacterium]|nr:undecaprenyldiphospho-muramoylpentapeptide beta-N-acetylglucosaminyltransferase [Candidatus Omnitrophota bacterium]